MDGMQIQQHNHAVSTVGVQCGSDIYDSKVKLV